MACPLLSTLVILSFLSLLIHYGVVSISDVSNVRSSVFLPSPADGSRRTTMLLPLFPPKNTSRRDEISRRHLLNTSPANARMSLHDDLLLNGYYTTHIWIGTPPHKFALIVDTGSTVTYVPCSSCKKCGNHQVMKELHSLKQIKGPDPSFEDICFSGAGSDMSQLSKNFAPVDMVFGDGNKLTLSPENYLFQHFKVYGAYCLGIFPNGKNPTSLLGDSIHPPPPPPSPPTPALSGLDNSNSTAHMSPSPAPSGPPECDIPGEVKIGLIKFYLSLSVNFSELKPRIPELAHVIAQELDINVSQVRLMNFSMKANDSLTKWAVFPAGYTDYMPNATAMEIIGMLAEHHPLLQDSFGSYKLFDWGIEPPPKRKLWPRNYLVLLVPVLVVLIVGLSAPVGWFIRRRRQESAIPYEPVGSVETVTHEQELQPLK